MAGMGPLGREPRERRLPLQLGGHGFVDSGISKVLHFHVWIPEFLKSCWISKCLDFQMPGFPNLCVSGFLSSRNLAPCSAHPALVAALRVQGIIFMPSQLNAVQRRGEKKKDVPYEVKQLSKVNEAKVSAGGKAGGVGRAPA